MRRPCWHFLQAGHSLTSSMQHPPSPDPTPLSALHAGPRIVGPEHLREIVHPIEVRRLVGRLAREQAHIDQREHDPTRDRKSTRLNSSHSQISYAVFCLKKKKKYKETALEHSSAVQAVYTPITRPMLAYD